MENRIKISYEPEADVLMWEISDKPIDFAKEMGNMVVHFTKNNVPVLVEILEARKFLTQAGKIFEKADKISARPAMAR